MADLLDITYSEVIEDLAEVDDSLMEKYLEGGDLSMKELSTALAGGLVKGKFLPVFAGSALLNMGVQPLMDFIASTAISPKDRLIPALKDSHGKAKELKPEESEPFTGYVFKTMSDPYTGKLSIIRCFSGTLNPDSSVNNSSRDVKERIGAIFALEGKAQKPLEQVGPGDIFAVAKLKETKTGDSLLSENSELKFSSPEYPEAVMHMAVKPKTKGDEDKIFPGLQRLMEEDPVLKVHRDDQTNEFILSGLGQVHIETAVDRLKRRFGVEVELKPPKVPYKETIKASTQVQGKYKKQTGGHGQFGDVWIEVGPTGPNAGFEFVNAIVGGAIPRQYIPAVEKGIIEAMKEGPLAGYPVVNLRVKLFDGSFHEVDSSEMAFKIAGSMAFKKAMEACKPILLEPIMNIKITVPEESMGDVMGDLNSRRAKIEGMEARGRAQELKAKVPMSEVLRYASDLTSITSGRGAFTLSFSHYEEAPMNIQEKVAKESRKDGG
jgi:elongation factor G